MREIKFRGWDGERMVYFDLRTTHRWYESTHPQGVDVDRTDIEQFTGLHDKNGKEIYEGDIARGGILSGDTWVEQTGIVEWDLRFAMWVLKFSDKENDDQMLDTPCTVIGNIHQNPELLE